MIFTFIVTESAWILKNILSFNGTLVSIDQQYELEQGN